MKFTIYLAASKRFKFIRFVHSPFSFSTGSLKLFQLQYLVQNSIWNIPIYFCFSELSYKDKGFNFVNGWRRNSRNLSAKICESCANNCPTRCDYTQFYNTSVDSSTCFGWYPHPSSWAHSNCNYNLWHGLKLICYRPLTWRIRNCCSDSFTSADGSKYDSTSARCCNYSLSVLLMMGEGIIRNM